MAVDGGRDPRAGGPGVDSRVEVSRSALELLFGPVEERAFDVRFWDGTVDAPPGPEPPVFTLVLEWPGALRRMLLPPTDRSVGEAYAAGDIDIAGHVEGAVRIGWERLEGLGFPGRWVRLWRVLRRLPARRAVAASPPLPEFSDAGIVLRHTAAGDALAVRHHYDLGNEFFRTFLDHRMQYSCAYFETGEEGLDEAQEAKLEMICRKLRLEPDQRLLDVGCGWGGLARFAAERYGVEATGITLSERQAEFARRSARQAGLEGRCRFLVRDYRSMAGEETFDRIASVGMIEHVGLRNYPAYFSAVRRLLAPGGLFLNQGIVHLRRGHTARDRLLLRLQRQYGSFFHRYIFPGSDLVPPGRTLSAAEARGFETRAVVSLREHYAETLRRWVARLEASWDEAVEAVGEPTARAWRFYMGASAHLFETAYLGLIQAVLAREGAPSPS